MHWKIAHLHVGFSEILHLVFIRYERWTRKIHTIFQGHLQYIIIPNYLNVFGLTWVYIDVWCKSSNTSLKYNFYKMTDLIYFEGAIWPSYFTRGRGKCHFYLTSEPEVMEVPHLACEVVFITCFAEKLILSWWRYCRDVTVIVWLNGVTFQWRHSRFKFRRWVCFLNWITKCLSLSGYVTETLLGDI